MSGDIVAIAAGLSRYTRPVLVECDPERVEADVATLLDLCLDDLADVRPDNCLFLTPLGLAVRAYLKGQSHD